MSQNIKNNLYPKDAEYLNREEIEKIILELNKNEIDPIDVIKKYEDKVYAFINSNFEVNYSVYDISRVYVLLKYIFEYNNAYMYKQNFRKDAYLKFFSSNQDKIKELIFDIIKENKNNYLNLLSDINVDVVKGSIYKIKKYFLETNKLKEIRGASALIDYANIYVTQKMVAKDYILECILYSGGGNIIIVLPSGCGKSFCKDIEEEYQKILLGCNFAFEYSQFSLYDLLFNYKCVSNKITQVLEQRKQFKLFPSEYDIPKDINIEINNKKINVYNNTNITTNKETCTSCNNRTSKFFIQNFDEENKLCSVCYLKYKVGSEIRNNFKEEYEMITKSYAADFESLEDISDYIAIIYGDGNNMGNVVMHINNIFEMMYFSRKTDQITKQSVYQAINKYGGDNVKFEIVALGGDDIFIIVDAKIAFKIASEIIKSYDESFNKSITMSVGILITKSKTPIVSGLSIAQRLLKIAKKFSKENNNVGTIHAFVLKDGYFMENDIENENFYFPCEINNLNNFIDLLNKMKKDNKINKSKIFTFNEAYKNMQKEEFQIFYLYHKARDRQEVEYIERNIKEKINDNFEYKCGVIYHLKNNKYFSPWAEILDFWEYV